MRRESAFDLATSENHAAQRPEKRRKQPSLNYKSAGLYGQRCVAQN
jgi:hypothetical protein